jgi:hypothetical protein
MLRAICLVLATAQVACVGPTLEVGAHEPDTEARDDAGELDAGELDAGDARAGRRDASFSDRDDMQDERRSCNEERDCEAFNYFRQHCNLTVGVCVQCYDDRQCVSGRCAESEGLCRKPDPGPTPQP